MALKTRYVGRCHPILKTSLCTAHSNSFFRSGKNGKGERVSISPFLFQLEIPGLFDEILMDRNSAASVRSRLDALKMESSDLEVQTRQLTDALETLVRIQARYEPERTTKQNAKTSLNLILKSWSD